MALRLLGGLYGFDIHAPTRSFFVLVGESADHATGRLPSTNFPAVTQAARPGGERPPRFRGLWTAGLWTDPGLWTAAAGRAPAVRARQGGRTAPGTGAAVPGRPGGERAPGRPGGQERAGPPSPGRVLGTRGVSASGLRRPILEPSQTSGS